MIEIIILFKLCGRIGDAARDKGRRAIGYQLMLLLFWFGGEVVTMLLAGMALVALYGEEFKKYLLFAYIAAVAGAFLGAWIVFRIVAGLPEPGSDELAESITAPDPAGG
jgi:hypothetical protein